MEKSEQVHLSIVVIYSYHSLDWIWDCYECDPMTSSWDFNIHKWAWNYFKSQRFSSKDWSESILRYVLPNVSNTLRSRQESCSGVKYIIVNFASAFGIDDIYDENNAFEFLSSFITIDALEFSMIEGKLWTTINSTWLCMQHEAGCSSIFCMVHGTDLDLTRKKNSR